jgi:hypothetical protein
MNDPAPEGSAAPGITLLAESLYPAHVRRGAELARRWRKELGL